MAYAGLANKIARSNFRTSRITGGAESSLGVIVQRPANGNAG